MIIEDLIRTGQLLTEAGMDDQEILRLVSDVGSPVSRSFLKNVFVLEIGDGEMMAALPRQVWGQEVATSGRRKAVEFRTDIQKAAAAPFALASSGNPLHPQGVYGVPVFPTYERQFADFSKSSKSLETFLAGRISRCPHLQLSQPAIEEAAQRLQKAIIDSRLMESTKPLGLVVVADTRGKDSLYKYSVQNQPQSIGSSQLNKGQVIIPRFPSIVQAYLSAKVDEGAEQGTRPGSCSVCGQRSDKMLVSIYCKSWPWAFVTWSCPVPHAGKGSLVEGVALDHGCYRNLLLGASFFEKTTTQVDQLVTRELFAPVSDREARRTTEKRSAGDITAIFGSMLLLPVIEADAIALPLRQEFGANLSLTLSGATNETSQLRQVIGFEAALPDGVDDTLYRLTLFYFSGDASRGDIHLRCVIEDVAPSMLYALVKIGQAAARETIAALQQLLPGCSDNQQAWYFQRWSNVPYQLARAYGGAYVWDQMRTILQRQPLSLSRPTYNVCRRISSLVRQLPKTESDIRDEILFYIAFLDLAQRYHQVLDDPQMEPNIMRHWNVLLEQVTTCGPEEMRFESTGELGFACGVLTKQFSRQYWSVTKVGGEGKDYLKHRILSFGSDLSPDAVWKKSLPMMLSLELKLEKLHLSDDFRRRVGIVLNLCDQAQEQIRAERDSFLAAFWSGYVLQKSQKSESSENSRNSLVNE